jgi:hypothetical protein
MTDPVVVGDVHLMKQTDGKAMETKCGLIGDVKSRTALKTTGWDSEITCPQCKPPARAHGIRRRV